MIPELFKIGPVAINSFGIMAMLAFLVPTLLLRKELVRHELDPDIANGIAIAAMIGGFFGSRLYYIFEHWQNFLKNPSDYIFTGAGLVWYGGLIGGAIAVAWYVNYSKISISLIADLMAPLLALGQVFGRGGCLLSGDGDYGPPSDLPWAMAFPNGLVPTSVPVHPTPIYDMIFLLAFFGVLWSIRFRQFPRGAMFGFYLVLIGFGRFVTEFFRITPVVVLGLTMAQIISLVLIAAGFVLILIVRFKSVRLRDRKS